MGWSGSRHGQRSSTARTRSRRGTLHLELKSAPGMGFRLVLCAATLLFGCNHGGLSSRAGTGMLHVNLTDAPIDLPTVQSVNVTLTGVTVYPKESTNPMQMFIG